MDYLTRQLVLELTKLREAFSKQNETICSIDEHTRKQEQFEHKWLNNISSKYDLVVRDNTIQQQREYRVNNSTRKATWIAAFAAVIAAVGAWWYACITNNMWKEVRTQTRTQLKQAESTDAAFVKASFDLDEFGIQDRPKFGIVLAYNGKFFASQVSGILTVSMLSIPSGQLSGQEHRIPFQFPNITPQSINSSGVVVNPAAPRISLPFTASEMLSFTQAKTVIKVEFSYSYYNGFEMVPDKVCLIRLGFPIIKRQSGPPNSYEEIGGFVDRPCNELADAITQLGYQIQRRDKR